MSGFSFNTAPRPEVPLNGHCSVIYNSDGVDTLYTFQKDAFQSLPLKAGATWSKLTMGTPVSAPQCVLGQWNHQDALIVVGGASIDGTPKDFPGLQYYTFASKTWAAIPTGQWPTTNRQAHSATFLNSSNSLLIYSGYQDNTSKDSSETFTITAEPPYYVQSHPAAAPLGKSPVLTAWNASHAVMTGGSATNRALWLFSMENEWTELKGVNVPNTIPDMTGVSALVISGTNDAKALQIFDLAAAPNTVTNVVVQKADSNPVVARQLDAFGLPAYNNSAVSIVERHGYSLAQSATTGLVVGSGGTGDAASPLVLFNQTANGWVTPQSFFTSDKDSNPSIQSALTGTTSSTATSAAPSATSSASTSSTASLNSASTTTNPTIPTSAVSTGGDGLSDSGRTILGAVLGGLAGLGALCVLLLLCLRWRKAKRRARGQAYHREDKNQMGFDDSEAIAGFNRSVSKSSKPSSKDEWQRMPTAQEKLGVTISKPNLIYTSSSPTGPASHGLSQPLISSTLPATKSDDGWNQYFAQSSSNSALMLESPDRVRMDSVSRHTDYTVSNYDHESQTASVYHDNDHDHDTAPLNPRSSGYPQSEQSWEQSKLHPHLARDASSTYKRPQSAISEEDSFLGGASGSAKTEAWEMLGTSDEKGGYSRRPASSIYADSINFPHPGDKVNITDDRSSLATVAAGKGSVTSDSRGMRTLVSKDLTGPAAADGKAAKDDMSWLTLK